MSRIALIGLLLASISSTVVAEVVIEEADFGGDFSNFVNDPTQIGVLSLGDTVVNGTIESIPSPVVDADIFTFTIDANQTLDAIILSSLDGDRHFFAFDDGNTMDNGVGEQLVARLIQGSDIGTNLLGPVPSGLDFGGTGVPDPVGPGDYTVWLQENTEEGVFAYSMTIQTSVSAVPEPSSLLALCGIGAVMGLRRRRR